MEVDEAATHIRDMVDPDANIIVGSAFNKDLDGIMRVSVVATGIDAASRPVPMANRPRAATGFAAQPSIFASAPVTPAAPPVEMAPQPAVEPVVAPVPDAIDAVADADAAAAEAELPEIAPEDDEIDLGVDAVRVPDLSPADTFRFTPSDPAPVPVAAAPPVAEPAAEPPHEERTPTLFEKMMSLSRGPKPKQQPSTLAPEPTPGAPDVDIPPFFKRQANN
jgi:cell division protein FtsZ